MTVVKVIFVLFAATVLLAALLIGWIFLDFNVIAPWQHERNTEKAERFNQTIWDSGFADVYTVTATVELNDEMHPISMDLICVSKMETEARSIKGGPYLWEGVYDFSPCKPFMPTTESSRVEFDVRVSCSALEEDAVERGISFSLTSLRKMETQHTVEPTVDCTRAQSKGVVQIGALRLHSIEVLQVKRELLSDVLSRERYGPADRSVAKEHQQD